MENNQHTFEEVTSQATICLKNKLLRADGTLHFYNSHWRRIKRYMESQNIDFIDAKVCKVYLFKEFENRNYDELTKNEKDTVKTVNTLIEFIDTGTLQGRKEATDFESPIGKLMINFLAFKISQRLAKHSVDEYEQHLNRFLHFLKENHVPSIKNVNLVHLLNYVKQIDSRKISLAHIALRTLRGFFKYLFAQRVIDVNVSALVPNDNYKSQPKIPSTYTRKEIEKLISSVDVSNTCGKRDYAIILLAARLGLRASDIANLRFENILWEQNSIELIQYKTGKKTNLPLLAEVGNAMIEYLKYGRPRSEEPFFFLCARSPFNPISSSVIRQIVDHHFTKTGINTKCRKHGPHALRHSLASRLLEQQTILPVISEVLGHTNTESARFYLRIDLTSLRECVLEVPVVSSGFYAQKGGLFYE
jgi:site-specific recombinase XerD